MKYISIILIVISLSVIAEDRCAVIEKYATSVMYARHSGASAVKLIEITKGNKLGILIVTKAFESPRFTIEPYRQNSINEFSNEMYMLCRKELGKLNAVRAKNKKV